MNAEQSDAIVVYGITGDLAYKKIFPALHSLIRRGRLDVPIIGVARSQMTTPQLVERARASIADSGSLDAGAFDRLASLLRYVAGDYQDADTFERLRIAGRAVVSLEGDQVIVRPQVPCP